MSSERVTDEQPMCFLHSQVFYSKSLSSPAYMTIENTTACLIDLSLVLDGPEIDIWTRVQTVCHPALLQLMCLAIKKMITKHFT